jgi:5-hydroxyisourate hydrolase
MSQISTHVLDTASGQPAAGVRVALERREDENGAGGWIKVGVGVTDANGRHAGLLPAGTRLAAGTWRLTFATGSWYAGQGRSGFWPRVQIEFTVVDAAAHHHVPLLLSPYGYATYRGS